MKIYKIKHNSVEPRDQTFVKGCGVLFFARNIRKNIGKNMSKKLAKLKLRCLKSSLCNYSNVYILVKGTITITRRGADQPVRQADERNKGVIKLCTIRKIATGQGDDYATGCSLDYLYFKEYCKLNAIDLSKQQALLDVNRKTMQQINFTGNLDRGGNTIMLFR